MDAWTASCWRAWAILIGRHAILRTGFDLHGGQAPLQWVHSGHGGRRRGAGARPVWPRWETRRLRLRAWIEEEQATPFDWSRPPLVRLAALALDERRFALGVAEHHSVLDGWSLQSLGTSCWRSTPTFSPVSSRGKRKRPR